jgi:hypothetical protein
MMNSLILPCATNGNRPPVKSVVLRRRGCLRGIRLVDAQSLIGYLRSMATDEAPNATR